MKQRRRIQPWSSEAADVLADLGSDASGLTDADAAERLSRDGPNALPETPPLPWWRIVAEQFRGVVVWLLVAAMALSAVLGEWPEAAAILAVLVINAAIGFATQLRAQRSMEGLRRLVDVTARVRRAGYDRLISARDIVIGDLLVLDGGDVVPADARLVEASGVRVDEAALTGESLPVAKSAAAVDPATVLADRTSMVHQGTAITRGNAVAVVVAVAGDTELGRISGLVASAERQVTPLEERLDRLGRRLAIIASVCAGAVVAGGLARGEPILRLVETGIALAVATVPEGLPIVATLALARGVWRMAEQNALVAHLPAVETLGATAVLLTDKTGTLTENRMTVARVAVWTPDGPCIADPNDPDAAEILRLVTLCNDAELGHGGAVGIDVGDPMEVALLQAARAVGITREEVLAESPQLRRHAFNPETRRMATVHADGSDALVAIKGAPESISAIAPADEAWHRIEDELAGQGMRVIAVASARRPLASSGTATNDSDLAADDCRDARFEGLVALRDPPRQGVADVLRACRGAGVRLVMLTGDHVQTATHIAREVGLVAEPDATDVSLIAVTGSQLGAAESWSHDVTDMVVDASVVARSSPAQKLAIIAAHQARGAVVAMLGDGVNDAPALRKADIGVAMGKRGTQVARDAAEIVLADDRLQTIVGAIGQGRGIFANIRRFVVYLLSCNAAEILLVSFAAGLRLPLLGPLLLLFINLVTDVFPALALGAVAAPEDVMRRPPRASGESILLRSHWLGIAGHAATIAAASLVALASDSEPQVALGMAFATLSLGQLWHVFNMAGEDPRVLDHVVVRSGWVWASVVLSALLVLAAVQWPPAATLMGIAPLTADQWGRVLGLSVTPLVIGRVVAAVRRIGAAST